MGPRWRHRGKQRLALRPFLRGSMAKLARPHTALRMKTLSWLQSRRLALLLAARPFMAVVAAMTSVGRRLRRTVGQARTGTRPAAHPWRVDARDQAAVSAAMDRSAWHRAPHEELAQIGGHVITRNIMQCLRPKGLVTDEVVNGYLRLLQDETACSGTHHVMSSFFLTKLTAGGQYSYANVLRWTRGVDLRRLEAILFPVNVDNMHWILVIAHMREHRLDVYDSLGGEHEDTAHLLARFLDDDCLDKVGGLFPSDAGQRPWHCRHLRAIPFQDNSFDCGVFVCMYARSVLLRRQLRMAPADVDDIRVMIASELLRSRVLPLPRSPTTA